MLQANCGCSLNIWSASSAGAISAMLLIAIIGSIGSDARPRSLSDGSRSPTLLCIAFFLSEHRYGRGRRKGGACPPISGAKHRRSSLAASILPDGATEAASRPERDGLRFSKTPPFYKRTHTILYTVARIPNAIARDRYPFLSRIRVSHKRQKNTIKIPVA